MDPILGDPPSTATLFRYINIGLLCVQESPADRPTMSDVIPMIVNEHVALPEPKQPAFVAGRNVAEPRSLMSFSGVHSDNFCFRYQDIIGFIMIDFSNSNAWRDSVFFLFFFFFPSRGLY